MRITILILVIFSFLPCFAQNLEFADDGKKSSGMARIDTIISLDHTIAPGLQMIFRKLDNNNSLIIGSDTLKFTVPPLNDSYDRFCLINNSSTDIKFKKQDGSLIAIKEAHTYNKVWKPIQYWIYSGCGLSYSSYSIRPGMALIFSTQRQKGSSTSFIRVRLKTESNGIIISEPFESNFDDAYFILNSENAQFENILKRRMDYLAK